MGNIRRIPKLISRRSSHNKSGSLLLFSVFTLSLSLAALSASAFADTATGHAQDLGVGISGSSVSISADGSVSFEVIPSAGGSLGVGKSNVSVSTNSGNGYRLYISGADYDADDPNHYTSLYYEGSRTNSSSKIYGLPSLTPTNFTSYNQWGFAVPSDASGNYPAASAYDDVAAVGTTIDSTTINNLKWKGVSANYTKAKEGNRAGTDNIDIYFGAYVNDTLMTGIYKNTIVYTAFVEGSGKATVDPTIVENKNRPITITVDYQGNPISADQISVSIYDTADPSKDIATCENISVVEGSGISSLLKITCDATPGKDLQNDTSYDIAVNLNNINGTSLSYSGNDVIKFTIPVMANGAYMQNMTAESCQNATPWDENNSDATTYKLIDKRGPNYSYLVRKLADGNCWMVQNLALPAGTTLSADDTDFATGDTYASNFITTFKNLSSSTTWAGIDATYQMYNGTHIDNTLDIGKNGNWTNTGAFYPFIVASAGYNINASSGDAPSSICPKNWKLPTSTSSGQFQGLFAAYNNNTTSFNKAFGSTDLTASCLTGSGQNNCPDASYVYSHYQASTILGQDGYYGLRTDSGLTEPSRGASKWHGLSVRCVLRK